MINDYRKPLPSAAGYMGAGGGGSAHRPPHLLIRPVGSRVLAKAAEATIAATCYEIFRGGGFSESGALRAVIILIARASWIE